MTTRPSQTASAPQAKTNELIQSIYRIALEPQAYDSFMGHWDDFILAQVDKLTTLQSETAGLDHSVNAEEISSHFAIAMQLLEQAGRPEVDAYPSLPRSHLPQLVFNSAGTLVWHNDAARDMFDLRIGSSLGSLEVDPAQLSELNALFSGESTAGAEIARVPDASGQKLVPMAFKLTTASDQERLFTATEVRQHWPENTGNLLAGGFGLSTSEIEICEMLVRGLSAADIAQSRATALGTVRTQIKKILHKTGSTGQVELVSLLHATMQVAEHAPPEPVPRSKIPDTVLNIQMHGRHMPVETFGDPSGTPVIFFHGMLDGNAINQSLRSLLRENGFWLICPVRPSFGSAPPDNSGPVSSAPARLARDIEIMMDQMQIKKALLLGHMAGSVYAMHTAAKLGKRVRGILSVAGGTPLVTAAQFATMSRRQRVVALTARYTPRILPFIIRAGINQLDNAGERQFLQSLYQNSPHDLRVIGDPEISEIIFSGYRFTVAQGHRAFEIDSYHVVRDWTKIAKASDQPIEFIHGQQDPVVSYRSVQDFHLALGNRARLTGLPDTGQLALYSNPKEVISSLTRLRSA